MSLASKIHSLSEAGGGKKEMGASFLLQVEGALKDPFYSTCPKGDFYWLRWAHKN